MKILSIKGKNLASLSKEFTINFSEGHLSKAGLFVITGPTGSGKSTLLDALSVALFDRIPRLDDKGNGAMISFKGSEEKVRSNDARTLLTRGTVEGFAEVEFVCKEGRVYRAKWSIRRARLSASGRLQNQEMSFVEVASGKRFGRTKKEVLQEIERVLGLTYEQFRRSVLLAQGDFAAFLKASEKERSELLEKMTGTEIYSQVSILSYERAKKEKESLELLQLQLLQKKLLSPQEREALHARIFEKREYQLFLKSRIKKLEVALQDIESKDLALKVLQEKERALSNWKEKRKLLEVSLLEISNIEKAEKVRRFIDPVDRSRSRLIKLESEIKEIQEKSSLTQELFNKAKEEKEHSKKELELVFLEKEKKEQEILEARNLDRKTEEATAQKKQELAFLKEEKKKYDKVKVDLTKSVELEDKSKKKYKLVTDWIKENKYMDSLVLSWDATLVQLKKYEVFVKNYAALLEKQQLLEVGLRENSRLLFKLEQERERLEKELARSQDVLEKRAKELKGFDLEVLSKEKEYFFIEKDFLIKKIQLIEGYSLLKQAISSIDLEVKQWKEEIQATKKQEDKSSKECLKLEVRLEEAESYWQQLSASKECDSFREQLKPEEPCFVCGSLEHPWAKSSVFQSLFSNHKNHLQALRKEYREKENQRIQAKGEQKHFSELVIKGEKENTKKEKELKKLEKKWKELLEKVKKEMILDRFGMTIIDEVDISKIDLDSFLPKIEEQLNQSIVGIEALSKKEKEGKKIESLLLKARKKVDQQSDLWQKYQIKFHEERVQEKGNEEKLLALKTQIGELSTEKKNLEKELSTKFYWRKKWEESLISSKGQFIQECQGMVDFYKKKLNDVKEILQQLHERELGKVTLEIHFKGCESSLKRVKESYDLVEKTLNNFIEQRGNLLDGKSVESFEEQLLRKEKKHRKNLIEKEKTKIEYEKVSEKLKNNFQHLRDSLKEERELLEIANKSLYEELKKKNLEEIQLRDLLKKSGDWLEKEKKKIQTCEEQGQLLKGRFEEAKEQYKVFEKAVEDAEEVKKREKEDLDSEYKDLIELPETFQKELIEILTFLQQDDFEKKQSEALRLKIKKQQDIADSWEIIRELIGSRDGNKFRVFAQSLTLECLIGYANTHLKDISPRYRLERVFGDNLDLQIIDQDMGDDVRSVNSLSGGESFLIALALALGLASLSSQKTQINSLFIDEGFGTLDPHSLDIAVDALDGLQALGRKVGVISHIPSLIERVGTGICIQPKGGGKSVVLEIA